MLKKILVICGLTAFGIGCAGDESEDGAMNDPVATDGSAGSAESGIAATPGNDVTGSAGLNSPIGGNQSPIGNAMGAAASFMNAAKQQAEAKANGLFVRVPHLYVRNGPGMKYQPVGTIKFNQQVQVVESLYNGNWVKIGEGQYVGGKYLSKTPNAKAWIPAKYAH